MLRILPDPDLLSLVSWTLRSGSSSLLWKVDDRSALARTGLVLGTALLPVDNGKYCMALWSNDKDADTVVARQSLGRRPLAVAKDPNKYIRSQIAPSCMRRYAAVLYTLHPSFGDQRRLGLHESGLLDVPEKLPVAKGDEFRCSNVVSGGRYPMLPFNVLDL